MDLHRGTQRTCRGCVSLLPPGGPGGSYSLVASMVLSEVPSFFLLSLFKLHYRLHYRLHSSIAARGQNTAPSRSGRAGATPKNFGRLTAHKIGARERGDVNKKQYPCPNER